MSEEQTEVPQVETPEVQEAQVEPVAQPDHSWVPKRISEITAARRVAEARAAELEVEVQRLRSAVPSEQPASAPSQSVEQLARAYAERMVKDQSETTSMQHKIQAINEAGTKEFGDQFEKSVQNLQMAGVGGPDFLKVLTSVPKAEALVTWLGKSENLNDAMRISSLDPVQMGIELTKMSGKVVKDLGKQISKAPAPIQTISGGAASSDTTEPDVNNTKEWLAWRQKTKKTRR